MLRATGHARMVRRRGAHNVGHNVGHNVKQPKHDGRTLSLTRAHRGFARSVRLSTWSGLPPRWPLSDVVRPLFKANPPHDIIIKSRGIGRVRVAH